MVGQFSVSGAEELLTGSYNIIKLKSSAHRQLSMRNDQAPFTDPRVRQAIALTLNRPQIVQALFKGYADVGNDSPFAPVFPSTNTSVAQRTQDVSKAKSLLAAAGHPSGFSTQLVTEQFVEIPQYAQIIAESAKAIGVNISLKVEQSSAYYGKGTFGNSDWLDATMSLVDYGHRGVPNAFLTLRARRTTPRRGPACGTPPTSPTRSTTSWRRSTSPPPTCPRQKTIAGQIETLLLDQTPVVFGYFYNYLTATATGRDRCLPDRGRAPVPVQRREELGLGSPAASALRAFLECASPGRERSPDGYREASQARHARTRSAGTTTGTCPAAGCGRPCSAPWTGWSPTCR